MLPRSSPLENQTLYAAMLVSFGLGSETVSPVSNGWWLRAAC
jgi:hypothetical protein